MDTFADWPHRRKNLLTDEWVLCSPHRASRPWLGQRESIPSVSRPRHDPGCHLCAGNLRANGIRNPDYKGTFVFTNDFRALLDESPDSEGGSDGLFVQNSVNGTCRVICYSPRHDLTLAQMTPLEITGVVGTWVDQMNELAQRFRWVQVFENKGLAMGCSNPHPHGQIWALDQVPTLPAREDLCQARYAAGKGTALLLDYAEAEAAREVRVVCRNEDWLAVVPYWATWPFETLLLPRFPLRRLRELPAGRHAALASLMHELLVRYDNLFETDFPYSMGWHGAPEGEGDAGHWQAHAHFYPPLLRSATVRKFMVGFEMLCEGQRDLTPECAAARLREVSPVRFGGPEPELPAAHNQTVRG